MYLHPGKGMGRGLKKPERGARFFAKRSIDTFYGQSISGSEWHSMPGERPVGFPYNLVRNVD
jgi:hypothetical protein